MAWTRACSRAGVRDWRRLTPLMLKNGRANPSVASPANSTATISADGPSAEATTRVPSPPKHSPRLRTTGTDRRRDAPAPAIAPATPPRPFTASATPTTVGLRWSVRTMYRKITGDAIPTARLLSVVAVAIARSTGWPSSAPRPSHISCRIGFRSTGGFAASGSGMPLRVTAATRNETTSARMAIGAVSTWTSTPPTLGPMTCASDRVVSRRLLAPTRPSLLFSPR